MKFKKPKFWDQKKPSLLSNFLLPFTFPLKLNNLIIEKYKKVKFNKILYCDRCYVNSIEWNKLLKFSQKTYVKESKISKEKGAGY